MDKTEKLALGKKKLRKYQAKASSGTTPDSSLTTRSSAITPSDINSISHSLTLPATKQVKLNDDVNGIGPTTDVHSQTIDVLVSEKTDLLSQLSINKTQLLQKQVECSELKEETKSLRYQLEHTQREKERLSLSLSDKTKLITSHTSEGSGLRSALQQAQLRLEEVEEEKNEMKSRMTQQAKEVQTLQGKMSELQNEVNSTVLCIVVALFVIIVIILYIAFIR